MTFRLRHLVAALILHILLFGLLAGGAQCSAKIVRPPPMQGVLLDASRAERKAEKKNKEEEAEKKKKREEEKERQEQEKKKQEDLKKQAQEKLEQQKLEQQKRLAVDAKKRKDDAEKKKREEFKGKKKKEEDKQRQEDAHRELQDKARLEDELRQEAMRREADKEASARAASEREKKQAEWAELLSRAVARKWTRPSTVTQDFTCKVRVLLLPDGSVSAANIVKSCGGGSALDKSVEDAVYRASPLPKPSDPSIFDRDLIINFEPGNQ